MSGHSSAPDLAAQSQSDPDAGWRRVHPLTPMIRSWQMVVIIVFFVVQDTAGGGFRGPAPPVPEFGGRAWLAGGMLVLLGLLAAAGMAVLSWRMTRFRLTGQVLEIHRGVLFRQHRRAQLDRIQAVDVVQPLLARVFGLARLNVEVAGAGDSNLELSFLTEEEAQRLRNQLLAGAAGLRYESTEAPRAPEHHWLEVPLGRLVGSILLSSATVVLLGFLAGAVIGSVVFAGAGFALLPALIGAAGVVWNRLSRGFGFRVATSPDGLRLRHGLLEQRSQTVPPGRVQAVRLTQPLLWRMKGWWRVDVNIAGYGASGDEEKARLVSTLLPVGSRDEVVAVLWFVFPDLGVEQHESPGAVVDAAMTGAGSAQGFVTSPPRARWLDWFSWRRNGFRITRTALLIRHGVVERNVILVPHARTQSLGVTQGPLQRALGLASFRLHSTPGPVSPLVRHLTASVAGRLLDDQADRARQARAAAGPERWMEQRVRPAATEPAAPFPPEPAPPPVPGPVSPPPLPPSPPAAPPSRSGRWDGSALG